MHFLPFSSFTIQFIVLAYTWGRDCWLNTCRTLYIHSRRHEDKYNKKIGATLKCTPKARVSAFFLHTVELHFFSLHVNKLVGLVVVGGVSPEVYVTKTSEEHLADVSCTFGPRRENRSVVSKCRSSWHRSQEKHFTGFYSCSVTPASRKDVNWV